LVFRRKFPEHFATLRLFLLLVGQISCSTGTTVTDWPSPIIFRELLKTGIREPGTSTRVPLIMIVTVVSPEGSDS